MRFEWREHPGHLPEDKINKDGLVISDDPFQEAMLTGGHRSKV